MERDYGNNNIRSIAAIIGSFLIQLTFGSAYSAENFVVLIDFKNNDYLIPRIIFGLAMFGLSASMSFGGFIEKKLKRSRTIFLGCIILSWGVFLSGIIFKSKNYLPGTYGLVCGLGAGLTYAISLGVPSQWIENSKGFITGIILSGFALGPIFNNAVCKYFNESFPDEKLFLIFAALYIVIQIFGVILFKKSHSSTDTQCINRQQIDFLIIDVESHKLFFEFDFWIIWLILALNSFGFILFFQLHFIILYFSDNFKYDHEITNVEYIYVVNSSNALGRILWGYFSDKISKQIGLFILNLGTFFMYIVLMVVFDYYKKNSLCDFTIYKISIGFYCVWLSGILILIPIITADRFGEKYFPTNYGFVFTAYTFAGILTVFLAPICIENMKLTLCILSLMSFLALLLSILLKFYPGRSITWRDFEKLICCKL